VKIEVKLKWKFNQHNNRNPLHDLGLFWGIYRAWGNGSKVHYEKYRDSVICCINL